MLRYPLFLLLVITAVSISPNDCIPFGLRLNYGRSVYDRNNQQRLALRFNTRQECDHIELLISKHMIVHCPTTEVSHKLTDYKLTGELYTTYIHLCSLSRQIEYNVETEYNLYDLLRSRKVFPENKKIRIKDPHRKDQEFRFLHVADWGPITLPGAAEKYEPIISSMVGMIKEGRADCVIINGDIGYELNSNVEFHELTMGMIEEVASLVPIILNRGNHEEDSPDNTVGSMFEDYFQLYGLEVANATGITVGPVFLAIIDPVNMLIPRLYPSFTEDSRYSSLEGIKSHLKQASSEGKTIIALSHYPLICGFPSPNHCLPNAKFGQFLPLYANLHDFYTLILKYGVPLVLSGHIHEYERTFPLISGYRSKSREPHRYDFKEVKEKFFIQVVEGSGGSNDGLESPPAAGDSDSWANFVASHDEGNTGFGLLTASGSELKYEHYRLPKGKQLQIFDHFVIVLPKQEESTPEL